MADDPSSDDGKWLSAFPALAAITDPCWHEVVQSARVRHIPAGTGIVRKGDPCCNFILIASGSVRVFERSPEGREIALYRTGAGEVCVHTVSNLLTGVRYSAEAVAETDVQAVCIPDAGFRKALACSEGFRAFLLSTLARRLGDTMQVVEQVAFQRLDLRLACLLGQLFGRRDSHRVSVTHEELAHELGTTRVVISRMLKDFERMGCIRLHHGEVELLSEEALARISKS
jgi:CRP/FNR family transcriptional regulator